MNGKGSKVSEVVSPVGRKLQAGARFLQGVFEAT
jgi:hypothetical protein